MVRSAADLCLVMCALSTLWVEPSRIPDLSRYQVKANYCVCMRFNASHHEIDQQIVQRFQSFIDKLRIQPGMEVGDAMPADIDPDTLFDIAVKLSGRLISTALNGHQRLTAGLTALDFRLVGKLADVPEGIAGHYQGTLKDSGERWNADKLRRECSRVIEILFVRYDVLLTPVSPVLASTHTQQSVCKCKLIVNGEPQDCNEHLFQNTLTTIFGLSATVYPLAKMVDELLCGIQIISGHFYDDVTINFAEFCESISGGSMVPEGYQRRVPVIVSIKTRRIQ